MLKLRKTIISAALSVSILVCSSVATMAAYEQKTGSAGGTGVSCEVGYSGADAYASVDASDNVDIYMNGAAFYNRTYKWTRFYREAYQTTYASTGCSIYGDWVMEAYCDFTVCGEDGDFEDTVHAY